MTSVTGTNLLDLPDDERKALIKAASSVNEARRRIHGSVRQILCNEMGLTPNFIAEEIGKRVQELKGDWRKSISEQKIDAFFEGEIARAIRGRWAKPEDFKAFVHKALEEEIRKFIRGKVETTLQNGLKLEINLPEHFGMF